MKLKKGSQAAKDYMAKIRKLKKPTKTTIINTKKQVIGKVKKAAVKKAAVKKAPAKSYHKDTKSHNVKISVVSGLKVSKNWFDFDVYKEHIYDIMKDNNGKKHYEVYNKDVNKVVYITSSLTLVKKYIDRMIKTSALNDKRKYQLDQLRNPNKYK